ncbi:MAG: hypothetical protein IKT55_04815 [Clostridia bacterium]|nr:hypothetical protein [Clostridia bacterium]
MERPAILSQIKNDIKKADVGTVFVPIDFALLTDKKTASVCLTRLELEKVVKKVMRGVYYKPEYNDFLDEFVAPEPDAVAHALARNYGWTIVPCGDTALNLLGLSTQIPAAWVYVSDGTYKEYTYEQTTIKFKRTTNKEISKLSYKTALVVQALKALGKDNVDDTVLTKLKNNLTESEKQALLTEAKAATSWIYEYIKLICRS